MVQRVAIYCRVSTTDQSCERQERDLLEYAAVCGFEVVGVWKETVSGTKHDRAERSKVMALAQSHSIDAILVTEMTRWGRSTIDLIETLQSLHSWHVSLIAQTGLQFDLNTPQGRLIAHLMASLAEFERDLVRERVRSGVAAAKARGQKFGRQPGQRVKADKLAPKVLQMVQSGYSYRKIAASLHLSKTTVNNIVKRHRLESNATKDNQTNLISNLEQPTMASKKSASDQTVYQLKITLKNIRPPIWRRIQVLSSTTLEQLHLIAQEVMGWDNYHMHSFSIAGIDYGQPQPEFNVRSEKTVKLSQVVKGEKSKFFYTYDFGDSWEHEILVEKELPSTPDTNYPVCITGKRACPPEDCGGSWGYAELLEIISDPSHPEYEERMEWVGESFNPDIFDLNEVNQRLREFQ
ncbi:phage integrase / plasmid pRiA4b ORF-3-like protein (plasmid) [Anabaenopsis circularis NIES-21]|uniref:Phage integrase / plasmid pRiA4b ORF-3-like protein n=1 Tax=Anabaenopsis circularis NIES-21 TaxID=1085406 RepID=A0A1Z4GGN0_9CYAN|nr:phage integrase / plasmid pRiA4b ORF-3-like protein [Anabaenopsis circularis NIES-21]BAY20231.1 phage integrase / plasmid pRiA4b ORF-3-like protein [Anabaenopsis circularis NIES-21]